MINVVIFFQNHQQPTFNTTSQSNNPPLFSNGNPPFLHHRTGESLPIPSPAGAATGGEERAGV